MLVMGSRLSNSLSELVGICRNRLQDRNRKYGFCIFILFYLFIYLSVYLRREVCSCYFFSSLCMVLGSTSAGSDVNCNRSIGKNFSGERGWKPGEMKSDNSRFSCVCILSQLKSNKCNICQIHRIQTLFYWILSSLGRLQCLFAQV